MRMPTIPAVLAALLPTSYYIFIDTVYGSVPSALGHHQPRCDDTATQLLLPVLGSLAAVPATAAAIPWLLSTYLGAWVLVSGIMLLRSVALAPLLGIDFFIAKTLLVGMDPRRIEDNISMDTYSLLMQMNCMDNTSYQLAVGLLGRGYFIAGLEAMLMAGRPLASSFHSSRPPSSPSGPASTEVSIKDEPARPI